MSHSVPPIVPIAHHSALAAALRRLAHQTPQHSYTTFYLTRGSLTYSAPAMVADPTLGFNLTHIGTMTSIFPMAYGVSKFAAGACGGVCVLSSSGGCHVASGSPTWQGVCCVSQARQHGGARACGARTL